MNEAQLRNLEYMLRGDFEDFSEIKESKVEEEIHLTVEDEPKTFLESFTETFDNFSALEINESEEDLINSLDINDELASIQEALDSIREKIMLNENVGELAAVAIPGLAAGASALIGALIRIKAGGDSVLPKSLANLLYDIKQFATNGKEKERREIIKHSILRNNPNIDPKNIDFAIDVAIKNADKLVKRPLPQNSARHGTYQTGYMQAQKERDRLKKLATSR